MLMIFYKQRAREILQSLLRTDGVVPGTVENRGPIISLLQPPATSVCGSPTFGILPLQQQRESPATRPLARETKGLTAHSAAQLALSAPFIMAPNLTTKRLRAAPRTTNFAAQGACQRQSLKATNLNLQDRGPYDQHPGSRVLSAR